MNKNQDVAFNLGVKKLWAHYANTNRSMTPMHIPKQTISTYDVRMYTTYFRCTNQ